MKKAGPPTKVINETTYISCNIGEGLIREEVWQDSNGVVVKYNLAFVNHLLCQVDNGRVLGYDNNHNGHHRHRMGAVAPFNFTTYEALLSVFLAEVSKLRKKKK